MAIWTTIRVFIASTFQDMDAERDHLVRSVFPSLRERLLPHRIHLLDIDLRWGILADDVEQGRVIELCLAAVDECRPFFIGILADRYGSAPRSIPPEILATEPWLAQYQDRSITELEMLHGALRLPSAATGASFYLRAPSPGAVDGPGTSRLASLKELIRESGLPVYDGYPTGQSGLASFGERVATEIWGGILQCCAIEDGVADISPEVEERELQDRFVESRLRGHVPRPSVQGHLIQAQETAEPRVPVLLTGPVGSGKSSILAALYAEARARPEIAVVAHFVGASPRSMDLVGMLGTIGARLRALWGMPSTAPEAPGSPYTAFATFRELLVGAPRDRDTLILIDGLDQIDPIEGGDELLFLPDVLPPRLSIALGCGGSSELGRRTRAHAAARGFREVVVAPLAEDEQRALIVSWLAPFAKRLAESDVRLFCENEAARTPLFLVVAIEELRGASSPAELQRRLDTLPRSATSVGADDGSPGTPLARLVDGLFARLEHTRGPALVRRILGLLAVSRLGLTERELLDLTDGAHAPGDVFAFLRDLRPYLQTRGPLLDFHHTVFRHAAELRYLGDPSAWRTAHRVLADYFACSAEALLCAESYVSEAISTGHLAPDLAARWQSRAQNPPGRAFVELPWHLHRLEDWPNLHAVLADGLTLMSFNDQSDALRRHWLAIEDRYDPATTYTDTIRRSARFDRHTGGKVTGRLGGMVGALLIGLGRYDDAERFFSLARSFEQSVEAQNADSDALMTSELNWATVLTVNRKPERALATIRAAAGRAAASGLLSPKQRAVLLAAHAIALSRHAQEAGKDARADIAAEAVARLREAYAALDVLEGPAGHDAVSVATSLALALGEQGEHGRAEEVLRETREAARKSLGPSHESYLVATSDLGGVLHRLGRYGEAVPLLAEALDGFRRRVGAHHPNVLITLRKLAAATAAIGDHGATVRHGCDLALATAGRYGALSHESLNATVTMAAWVIGMDRAQEINDVTLICRAAEQLLPAEIASTEEISILLDDACGADAEKKRKLGDAERIYKASLERRARSEDPRIRRGAPRTARRLAMMWLDRGNDDEAERWMREVVRMTELDSPASLASTEARSDLAGLLANLKKNHEAAAIFTELLMSAQDLYGTAHEETIRIASNLSACLCQLGQTEAAVTLFRRILANLDADPLVDPDLALAAATNLSACLRREGHPADAEATLRSRLAPLFARASREAALAHYELGYACLDQGKLEEAVDLIRFTARTLPATTEEVGGARRDRAAITSILAEAGAVVQAMRDGATRLVASAEAMEYAQRWIQQEGDDAPSPAVETRPIAAGEIELLLEVRARVTQTRSWTALARTSLSLAEALLFRGRPRIALAWIESSIPLLSEAKPAERRQVIHRAVELLERIVDETHEPGEPIMTEWALELRGLLGEQARIQNAGGRRRRRRE